MRKRFAFLYLELRVDITNRRAIAMGTMSPLYAGSRVTDRPANKPIVNCLPVTEVLVPDSEPILDDENPLLTTIHNVTFTGPRIPIFMIQHLCVMVMEHLTHREQIEIRRVCRTFYRWGTAAFLLRRLRFTAPVPTLSLSAQWNLYRRLTYAKVERYEVSGFETLEEARSVAVPRFDNVIAPLTSHAEAYGYPIYVRTVTQMLVRPYEREREMMGRRDDGYYVSWCLGVCNGRLVQVYRNQCIVHEVQALSVYIHDNAIHIMHINNDCIVTSAMTRDGNLTQLYKHDVDPAAVTFAIDNYLVLEIDPDVTTATQELTVYDPATDSTKMQSVSSKYLDIYDCETQGHRISVVGDNLYFLEDYETRGAVFRITIVTPEGTHVLMSGARVAFDGMMPGILYNDGSYIPDPPDLFNRYLHGNKADVDLHPGESTLSALEILEDPVYEIITSIPHAGIIHKFQQCFCAYAPPMIRWRQPSFEEDRRWWSGLEVLKFKEIMLQEHLMKPDEELMELFPGMHFMGNVTIPRSLIQTPDGVRVNAAPYLIHITAKTAIMLSMHALGASAKEYVRLVEECEFIASWTLTAYPIDRERELWVIRLRLRDTEQDTVRQAEKLPRHDIDRSGFSFAENLRRQRHLASIRAAGPLMRPEDNEENPDDELMRQIYI